MKAMPQSKHMKPTQIMLPRGLFREFHKGFSFVKNEELSPAQGFAELHDAVCEAFSRVDLPENARGDVNDLINSLQSLNETLAEQEAVNKDADGYFIDREDLAHVINNLAALGEAIRMHQTELAHHDIAKAILWSKTALKKIIG